MRVRNVTSAIAVALAVLGQRPAAAQEALTYADLIRRVSDVRQTAVLPAPGETCRQWSSGDRSSRYDAATGKYVRWSANNDGSNFIRAEGDQGVMAEMEGPGCIWRIWSAQAKKGHVRIYLDGSETPAVDLPFRNYFTGEAAPFAYPMLSYSLAKHGASGLNLYFPIPYQKSCKIVADKGWGRYYQIGYTTFPAGIQVPTFSKELAAQHSADLEKLDAGLRDRLAAGSRGDPKSQGMSKRSLRVGANGTTRVAELAGPAAITSIRAVVGLADRADEMAALRELCIQITFDDQPKPVVWCPLGDFFGTAPGKNLYNSLLTGMNADGFWADWYMPFAKKAVVELVNDGPESR